MSDIEKVMVDLTALKEEFGVEFQLADPGAPVTVEQRMINNLFCALLEARAALGDAKPRPGTDSPVPRTYWFKEPDDDTEAALGDVEPEPLEDVRREFRRIDQKQGRAKAAYFAYGAAKALNMTVRSILQRSFDEQITEEAVGHKGDEEVGDRVFIVFYEFYGLVRSVHTTMKEAIRAARKVDDGWVESWIFGETHGHEVVWRAEDDA